MKRLILLIILILFPWLCHAQKIVDVEYYIDEYRAMGNGTKLNITETSNNVTIDAEIDVSSLDPGPHIIYFRTKNENGVWSLSYSGIFIKPKPAATQSKIVSYEYGFDDINKMGGSGNIVTLEEPAAEINHSIELDVTDLSPGPHVLFMKIIDETGMQSFLYKQTFIKIDNAPPAPIVALEYYFVNQTGDKSDIYRTNDFEPAVNLDLTAFDFSLNAPDLTYGNKYALHIRVIDEKGVPSHFLIDSLVFREDEVPYVVNEIPDQELNVGDQLSLTFNYEDFNDPDMDDGDTLIFKAKTADGNPLPEWITFDPVERKFTGTPEEKDAKVWHIKLFAHDLGGAKVSNEFTITVVGQNKAPVANITIDDQKATVDEAFIYTVPEDAFSDPDQDQLTITCYQSNGSAIPEWLAFDADNKQLSGKPGKDDIGNYDLILVCKDSYDAADTISFSLEVVEVTGIADNFWSDGLIIHPNPTEHFLNISIHETLSVIAGKIRIYALNGKETRLKYSESVTGKRGAEIDLSNYRPGVYLLEFSGKEVIIKKKFIKK